jgi:hypothetical protein
MAALACIGERLPPRMIPCESRRLAAAGHFWRPSGMRRLSDGPSMFQRGEGLPIDGAANDPQDLGDVRRRRDKVGFAACHCANPGLNARPLDRKNLRLVAKTGVAGVNAVLADCRIAVIGIGPPGHSRLRKERRCRRTDTRGHRRTHRPRLVNRPAWWSGWPHHLGRDVGKSLSHAHKAARAAIVSAADFAAVRSGCVPDPIRDGARCPDARCLNIRKRTKPSVAGSCTTMRRPPVDAESFPSGSDRQRYWPVRPTSWPGPPSRSCNFLVSVMLALPNIAVEHDARRITGL